MSDPMFSDASFVRGLEAAYSDSIGEPCFLLQSRGAITDRVSYVMVSAGRVLIETDDLVAIVDQLKGLI